MNNNNNRSDDNFFERLAESVAQWSARHKRVMIGVQLGLMLAIIVAAFAVFLFDSVLNAFTTLNYAGAFVANLIASATVVLPAPGLAILCAFSNPELGLNIYWLALASAAGSTVGETISYLIGYTGRGLVDEKNLRERMDKWGRRFNVLFNWMMRRFGRERKLSDESGFDIRRFYGRIRGWQRFSGPILFALAVLPLPLFDVAGILAGSARYPLYRFYIWVLPGKFIKLLALVWACRESIGWFQNLFGL